jgi:hypothetical protein
VNITVKAPPGGRYDVDVQKVKERYLRWRKKIVIGSLLYAAFVALSISLLISYGLSHFKEPMQFFWSSFFPMTLTFLLVFLALWKWWGNYIFGNNPLPFSQKKFSIHFECPFENCG